ncbi:MAG TPA: MBL fold metallo-hydrolase [Solirubrobacterales bacterium]|nr:MBL fold metallo-hydrolase [Solirubrobacterales bacterium]
MLGEEIRPGLWRWTAHYEEWGKEVACVAVGSEDELVLIDPLLVGNHWDQLERALGDRRLHVLLTIHWHARSAAEVAERFPGPRVWAHSRDRAAVARRAPVTDVFRLGDDLPAGLVAIEARPRSEVLFWEPRSRALIVGDALLGDGENGEGLHTCPAWWLPGSLDLEDLRGALRPALDLPVEVVLPSHGSPVFRDAREELARVAAGRDL